MGRARAVFFTALSGVPTVIGGGLGILLGGISDVALGMALAGAGGAMLYVVFGEILPQSAIITKTRGNTFAAMVGILIGLLLMLLEF